MVLYRRDMKSQRCLERRASYKAPAGVGAGLKTRIQLLDTGNGEESVEPAHDVQYSCAAENMGPDKSADFNREMRK